MSMFVKLNGVGVWTVWKAAHIACVGAEATEAIELRHRQGLHSAKAVGEPYVPVLQSIKAESVILKRREQNAKMITAKFSQYSS